jgi:hypothetical protein
LLKKMRRRKIEVWRNLLNLFIFLVLSDKNQPSLPSASIIYTSTGNSILFLFFLNHFLSYFEEVFSDIFPYLSAPNFVDYQFRRTLGDQLRKTFSLVTCNCVNLM